MHIRSAIFQISAPDLRSCPEARLPEIAVIGRSNVGKSSLLNMLVGQKTLAKVSPKPGHTKLINFFAINNQWNLVDLPGYGYAKTSHAERARFQQTIAEYLSGRTSLVTVLVLIDSRHTPQVIDLEFIQWLSEVDVPMALVFTKTDMSKPNQVKKNIELFMEKIAPWFGEMPPIFQTSSKTRDGRAPLLAYLQQVLDR
jgi:GTP-binding protein